MMRALAAVCVLALSALAGWLGRSYYPAAPSSGAPAQTCRVARGRLEQNVKSAVGYVKPAPNALVRVGFPTIKDLARAIRHLTVQEGDHVSPGAVLAQLDHADLDAALAHLAAELRVSESRQLALE